jgi:putative endonuclease
MASHPDAETSRSGWWDKRVECPERAQRVEGHLPVLAMRPRSLMASRSEGSAVGLFYVYILRCADGTFYVGLTSELPARTRTHNQSRGPRFTGWRLPATLIYSEPFSSMSDARRREVQLKKRSRAKKQALVSGNLKELNKLSRAR